MYVRDMYACIHRSDGSSEDMSGNITGIRSNLPSSTKLQIEQSWLHDPDS